MSILPFESKAPLHGSSPMMAYKMQFEEIIHSSLEATM
jgi:hypothetical protein